MPTPPKPVSVLRTEKKSYRTKAELAKRQAGEESLLTGKKLKEDALVKQNPHAHKEFIRMKALLKGIDKADDLYGATINRYCMLRAEELELLAKLQRLDQQINVIYDRLGDYRDAEFRDLSASLASLEKTYASLQRSVHTKRKMQSDIERENVMTIASALRSIPKKVDEDADPLKEILNGRIG